MKKKWSFGLLLILSVIGLTLSLDYSGVLQRAEWIAYDHKVASIRKGVAPHQDVVLVLVDEASLKAMNPLVGRWPWPRSLYADLLEFLSMGGAKAVAFDILFTENERDRSGAHRESLSDEVFAQATAEMGAVVHSAQFLRDVADDYNQTLINRPLPGGFVKRFDLNQGHSQPGLYELFSWQNNNNYYLPIEVLAQQAAGVGLVDFDADRDGVFRRTSLLRQYQQTLLPVLSVASLMQALRVSPELYDGELRMGQVTLPVDDKGRYLVNFYRNFNAYSISGLLASIQMLRDGDIENLIVDPEEFRDKIVFVGSSAVGIEDLKTTPFSNKTPGVMLHASIASNVLSSDFLQQQSQTTSNLLVILFAVITVLGILFFPSVLVQILLPILLAVVYLFWGYWRFEENVLYPTAAPILTILLSWLSSFVFLTFTEGRDKRKVRRMLSQYVSPAVLSEVENSYSDFIQAKVGTKEEITILFSDIRGFTDISESLSAEKVVDMLNTYFSSMTEIIFREQGTVDKFIGDAIMAFWGAPIRIDNHADQALKSAMAMIIQLEQVNLLLKEKGYPEIKIGVGLNTGEVVLGNIGSEQKLDYTVIGDNVNLASRLEGLTKAYVRPILMAEETFLALKAPQPCVVVDLVRVKGKQHPSRLFTPLFLHELADESAEKLTELMEQAFNHYLQQQWQQAIYCYQQTPLVGLASIMIARCEAYMQHPPPPGWDGVHVMKEK